MSLAIMYRQVQQVPASAWSAYLELEKRMDAAEAKAGHPLPRRYRSMFGGESAHIRVCERIYESYVEFGELLTQRNLNDELQKLDAEKFKLLDWERAELYYLDSGAPVPRWMQAISRKPFAPEHIDCAIPRSSSVPTDPELVRRNIQEGKVRVMYRQIQCVPKDRWAEKIEQERISDEVEAKGGNPLPLRYRSMHSTLHSQIRVNEREYDSFEELCRITENFFAETTAEDAAMMDAEARRQDFFTWEREEFYYVDSDCFTPEWMYMTEQA